MGKSETMPEASHSNPRPVAKIRLGSLATAKRVTFSPLSYYNPLIDHGMAPIFTGIQTCEPGYVVGVHWHPYVECLLVLDGEAYAWLDGKEDEGVYGKAGDIFELPAMQPHGFKTVGDKTLRVLGIHCSPVRVVNFVDSSLVLKNGYQVLDSALQPTL